MEVVVEYEYEALHEDELTLRPGDIIKNVRCIEEDGWMEGDLNGKRGLFPDNFVKELKKDSKEAKETKNETKEEPTPLQKREKSPGNVANLVQRMSTIGIPMGGFQPHPPVPSKKPKKRQCKALFEYQPQNEDELELKIGDIIEITEEVEEGWWSGTVNGKSGLFPSNFVKEVDAAGEEADSNDATAAETDGTVTETAATPASPQATSGNGAIVPPKKIIGVGFGDIFSGGSVKLKARLPSPEMDEKKDKPSAHPHVTDSHKGDGDSKAINKRHSKEYCKVTFAFEATNEDELTLKVGDIIHILSKDTGEPGWWRGEVGGKEGVFPDNFVVMVNDVEKEAGLSRGSVKSSPKQDPEEKPVKPPPPSKGIAPKPEVPSADRKPHSIRQEDRAEKAMPEPKPSKPAPLPPPKPAPPGKGRPSSHPPKKPDKPLTPSSSLKHNGEVPSTRPKSDVEPLPPTKPKPVSGEWSEKSSEPESSKSGHDSAPPRSLPIQPDPDLMSFDDLSSTSDKLSHPTANRPKMPGRRPPTQFGGGHSPNKEVNVEKSFKMDEDNGAKPKLTETRKATPSTNTVSQSPSLLKHTSNVEAKPSPGAASGVGTDGISSGVKGRLEAEDQSCTLEELKSQMKELLLTVELLKAQQMKEISELRGELDEEKQKRVALQMEIEKLKRTVHST